ncbi:MAG: hypothetical protein Q7R47_01685, partial [Candidatus Diapherotrites archaeon]|nr:hypothetical protein [Candidatus Diapherotrites archaeon]
FSSIANADGFADTQATQVTPCDDLHSARQVNQLWGDLDSGEYDFWVKVSLPDSASATQRLKFGVKAFDPQKTGGAGFDQKTDSQEYALHQSLCTVGCSEDQIQWEVLVAKDGSPKPGAESPYQLQKGQVYSVWLRIRNTTPDSYNSTMIQVSSDPALTLTFPTGKVFPEEFGPVVLPANDVYQSSNWLFKFRADTTSNLATMDFLTKPITNLTGAAHPVSFKVNDDKQLKVELFSVPLDSRLFVDVMDAVSGAPVISTIRIKRNATASEIANPSTITGWETPVAGNSSFTFENFSMLAGEKALIQASATSYETKNVVLDGSEFNTYRLATGFDCIKTTWWPDWTNSKDPAVQMDASQPLRPALVSGITGEDQKSVSIDAQACKEPMDVKLLVFGSLTDLDFGAGVSMERGQQSPSSISVKLNGTLQGVIPIGVWVKRRSDSEWQLKELHEIYSLVKDAKTDVYG